MRVPCVKQKRRCSVDTIESEFDMECQPLASHRQYGFGVQELLGGSRGMEMSYHENLFCEMHTSMRGS